MENGLYSTLPRNKTGFQPYIDLETSSKVKHAYLKSNLICAIYRGVASIRTPAIPLVRIKRTDITDGRSPFVASNKVFKYRNRNGSKDGQCITLPYGTLLCPLTQPSGKDPDPLSGVARDVALAGQLEEGIWELNDHPNFFCQ
jgi:hypothetical protein